MNSTFLMISTFLSSVSQTQKPLDSLEYPKNTHLRAWTSSFPFPGVFFSDSPLQLKVLRYERLRPGHFSKGIPPSRLLEGYRFLKWFAVDMACPKNGGGRFASIRRHLAISINVRFFLYATPFCCGVWGIANLLTIPHLFKYRSNSRFRYSVPLADCIPFIFLPVWFSTRFW